MPPRRRTPLLLLATLAFLSGCGTSTDSLPSKAEKPPIPVTVRTVAEGAALTSDLTYPAVIASNREVTVVAKAAGTVTRVAFELGDRIERDALLASIDEGKDNAYRITAQSAVRGKLNAMKSLDNAEQSTGAQVKQVELAVSQARAARDLAASALRNTQTTTQRTIRQAELAAEQARTGRLNTGSAADASLLSVQVGVERAQNALDLAKESRSQKTDAAEQAQEDLEDTAQVTLASVAALGASLLDGTNLQTGLILGSGITLPYAADLGNQNPATKTDAQTRMTNAWSATLTFRTRNFSGTESDVQTGLDYLAQVRGALDATKLMLEATTPTQALPLSATAQGGPSLSTLRSVVGGYQAQLTGSIAQLTGVQQGLRTLETTNDTIEENLDKAVRDAELQLEAARRGEDATRIGGTAQRDAASGGEALALNAVESARAGATAQLDAARLQVRLADLQIQNAEAALALTKSARTSQLDGIRAQIDQVQGQLDLATYQLSTLVVRAPTSGAVTRRFVSVGDTVAPGSPVATLSETGALKATFGISAEELTGVRVGQGVSLSDQRGNTVTATIARLSPTADPQTRRFSVEATIPATAIGFVPGIVADATLSVRRTPSRSSGTTFLPLQAITISQNETTVLTVKDGRVAKLPVTLVRVVGEIVEVAIDAAPATQIILSGSPLLTEGVAVTVSTPGTATPVSSPRPLPSSAQTPAATAPRP